MPALSMPGLTTPTLFIARLPSHVSEEHIKALFRSSHPTPTLTFSSPKGPRKFCHVDFPDLRSAEKALATLHLRPIPSVEPSVILEFCTSALKPLKAPDAPVSPRLIRTLPSGCTEATLYDSLGQHGLGPIYSVRIDPIAGGLVQFWVEADAREAESRLAAARPKLMLEAYDPCALFCSNINFDVDTAVLRTYFAEYGTITSTEILTNPKTGKSRGLAFIAFSQASEAYAALHAAHGSEIHWRRLSLTYRVLKKVSKPRVPTSKTAGAQRQPQPRHGAGGIDAFMQEDAPSSDERKDKSEDLTEPTETAAPSPQASTDSNAAETSAKCGRCSELDHLQALYDAEVQQRTAAQAENALLRRELEAEKSARELAESRLKILQLEKDRPLWEEARQKREEAEKAARAREEACRREAEVEESRRKMREFVAQERERKEAARMERLRREAEEKARQEKEERERQAREQEERERVAREARERQKREQRWRAATEKEEARCQNRDRQLWGDGDWTVDRALRRLRIQMDEFDKLKFSEAQPLTFSVVPWPLLTDPLALDLEEITWAAVESFFARMKARMVADLVEYSNLIERVHRMFHPDKWKARGILATVLDEETRNSLEAAGNVVAQAVTPLWRKSKGYT